MEPAVVFANGGLNFFKHFHPQHPTAPSPMNAAASIKPKPKFRKKSGPDQVRFNQYPNVCFSKQLNERFN